MLQLSLSSRETYFCAHKLEHGSLPALGGENPGQEESGSRFIVSSEYLLVRLMCMIIRLLALLQSVII